MKVSAAWLDNASAAVGVFTKNTKTNGNNSGNNSSNGGASPMTMSPRAMSRSSSPMSSPRAGMAAAATLSGAAQLTPETDEDMWELYNLVEPGDLVRAVTMRKVYREDRGGLQSRGEAERVRMTLSVTVAATEFDSSLLRLRVRGNVVAGGGSGGGGGSTQNGVRSGSSHTIELETHRCCTLSKPAWDAYALQRLRELREPAARADLAVLLAGDGHACLVLVGGAVTALKGRVSVPLPRKRPSGGAAHGYERASARFRAGCLQLLAGIDAESIKCIVIAGPGLVPAALKRHVEETCARSDKGGEFAQLATIVRAGKLLVARASSGYRHSLREVLQDESVMELIKDTKAAAEVRCLAKLEKMIADDSSRAVYGPVHVKAAAELGAIDCLLISDTAVRAADAEERRRYASIMEDVTGSGGDVKIFSSLHVSGQRLEQLSGVAALLRFPCPQLEDDEFDSDL